MATSCIVLSVILIRFIIYVECLDFFYKNSCPRWSDYPWAQVNPNCVHNPDVLSNLVDMVARRGYSAKLYTVTTDDGYIINMFRLQNLGRQPVFLQHGITTNGNMWVDKPGNRSLAFFLYDEGYDVWIGNIRGGTYSKSHMRLSLDDTNFWNYNIDSLALYDLPAMLELVVFETKQRPFYIGFSMGSTQGLMFAANKPKRANTLLKGMFLLAPIANTYKSSFVSSLAPFEPIVRMTLELFQIRVFFKNEKLSNYIFNILCRYFPYVCLFVCELFLGKDPGQLMASELLLMFSSWPTAMSRDTLLQFFQMARDKQFQMFDYGFEENMKIYSQPKPPGYNLGNIQIPVAMFYGRNDPFCVEEDVRVSFNKLASRNKTMVHIFDEAPFDHADFEYAKDLSRVLYPLILKGMKGIENSDYQPEFYHV